MRLIKDVHHLQTFHEGEVLVTDKTDPDWEPIMKKAAAIITNRGTHLPCRHCQPRAGRARVGTEHGTDILCDGQVVTVSCAEGETGVVYDGALPFTVERVRLQDIPRPTTKVMLNMGNPEEAFALSFLPNDGVGLAGRSSLSVTPSRCIPWRCWTMSVSTIRS